jgi:hypothetical protein
VREVRIAYTVLVKDLMEETTLKTGKDNITWIIKKQGGRILKRLI